MLCGCTPAGKDMDRVVSMGMAEFFFSFTSLVKFGRYNDV